MSKILFIGAHTDDVELSCGGTINKLIDQLSDYGGMENDINVLTLSRIYSGVDLEPEWSNSMLSFGDEMSARLLDFETRNFNKSRQEILQYFYDLQKKEEFETVFTHSPFDLNQDHSIVGQESIRAFKHTNLITYCADWNTRDFTRNYFVKLEAKHIQKKIEALACYKSQVNRKYMNPDYTWANALNIGVICNTKYAESFQAINLIQ